MVWHSSLNYTCLYLILDVCGAMYIAVIHQHALSDSDVLTNQQGAARANNIAVPGGVVTSQHRCLRVVQYLV